MRWFILIVIFCLFLGTRVVATPFGIQNGEYSVDLAVADSDRVVVGKIISVEPAVPPGAQSLYTWLKVTVQVRETLVGEHEPVVVFWQPDDSGPGSLRQDPTDCDCIICLVKGERYRSEQDPQYQDVPLTLWGDLHPWGVGFWRLGTYRGTPPMMQWDKPIRVDTLRELLEPRLRRPSAPVTDIVWIYGDRGYKFRVPMDENTEKIAREWASSEHPVQCWDAFEILRIRHVPENVAALKAMIALPVKFECQEVTRERVVQQLKDWGEAFEQPVRVQSGAIFAWRELSFWLSVVGLFAGPCIYAWFWRRDRASIHRYWRVASMAWLIAASLVAVVWGRSYLGLDAFCHHEWTLGAVDGNVLLSKRGSRDLTPDFPLAYCRVASLPTLEDVGREHWKYLPDRFRSSQDWQEFFCKDRAGWYDEPRRWHDVYCWRLPIWMVAAALCVVALFGWSGHWTRRFRGWLRARRTRGFPVALHS